MPRFLALGECMIEMTPLENGLYRRGFAGDTFNAAWYARRILPPKWCVAYGTVIGQDAASDEMLRYFQTEGIETDAVRRISGRTVGLYMIALDRGERSFSYWRSHSAAKVLAQDQTWLEGILKGADILYFSGITLAILSPQDRQRFCAALAKARAGGARVVFDTNLRPALWENRAAMQKGIEAGAKVSDIVLPSLEDEAALFEEAMPETVLQRYLAWGARMVVAKSGAQPLHIARKDGERWTLHPQAVTAPVDTTAAGDSFGAAFCAYDAMGYDVPQAAQAAMTLAAQVVQSRGALVRDIFEQSAEPNVGKENA